MKEKLFRGKRIDNGEWVYGDYFRMHVMGDVEHYISTKPFMLCNDETFDNEPNEVICDTINEYSGLPDNNGNKIFEEDIIKTKFYGKESGNGVDFNDYDYFQVVYHEASFCIENATRRFVITAESAKRFEIIGNIHDNPELLELKQ